VFPSILDVFYDILTFVCITFDALQMHLIVTDVVVTLTLSWTNCCSHFVFLSCFMIAPKFLSAIVPTLLTTLYVVWEYLATKCFCTCWKEEEDHRSWNRHPCTRFQACRWYTSTVHYLPLIRRPTACYHHLRAAVLNAKCYWCCKQFCLSLQVWNRAANVQFCAHIELGSA